MLKHPEHRVGDAWFYVEQDLVHAYYLVCPESVEPHTFWDIGHATSRDLIHWELHPLALRHGEKDAWNERLATGSIFRKDGRYGMAFTSHARAETGLAWSDDLFEWTMDPVFPTTTADLAFYEPIGTGKRTFRHWRDPFVFEENGEWYQFVCASDPKAPLGARGAVGVAVLNGNQWEIRPPLKVEPFCEEMECPQIVKRHGLYYLLFSTMADFVLPRYHPSKAYDKFPWGGTFHMMSDSLLGPYHVPELPLIIPGSVQPSPYACQWVGFKGRDYLLGTIWVEGEISYLSDPYLIQFTPFGIEMV